MFPVPQQIPVEQEAEAVVRVAADVCRIQALRPIRRDLPPEVPNLDLDFFGLTIPSPR